MNRARNTDHARRTCERFVYSKVKITRLYDYQTWQTSLEKEVRKGMWAFFSRLLIDWAGNQSHGRKRNSNVTCQPKGAHTQECAAAGSVGRIE